MALGKNYLGGILIRITTVKNALTTSYALNIEWMHLFMDRLGKLESHGCQFWAINA